MIRAACSIILEHDEHPRHDERPSAVEVHTWRTCKPKPIQVQRAQHRNRPQQPHRQLPAAELWVDTDDRLHDMRSITLFNQMLSQPRHYMHGQQRSCVRHKGRMGRAD